MPHALYEASPEHEEHKEQQSQVNDEQDDDLSVSVVELNVNRVTLSIHQSLISLLKVNLIQFLIQD